MELYKKLHEGKASNVSELIEQLEIIKKSYGDLPLLQEYEASYWFGFNVTVTIEHNPDDILGDKITVVMIS